MKVSELIEALKACDPNAVVFVFDDLDFERDITLAPVADEVVPVFTGEHGTMAISREMRRSREERGYWTRPAVVIGPKEMVRDE